MSRFLEPLDVTTEDGKVWTVNEPMDYEIGSLGSGEKITVPKGQKTDFGSVPQALWWLISPIGLATRAFVLHDYLYTVQKYSRLKSDQVLLEAMGVLSVPWLRRHAIYRGVRMGGFIAWNQHKKENLSKLIDKASAV